MQKSPDAFRTISEVAAELDIPQHVLRFWETRFSTIRPLKRGGGRRYYRPDDVDLLKGIRQLLYGHGYTIKGVQRILKSDGPRYVQAVGRGDQSVIPAAARGEGPGDDDEPELGDFEQAELSPEGELDAPARPAHLREPGAAASGRSAEATGRTPAGLSPDDAALLRTALEELRECERILGTLRAD